MMPSNPWCGDLEDAVPPQPTTRVQDRDFGGFRDLIFRWDAATNISRARARIGEYTLSVIRGPGTLSVEDTYEVALIDVNGHYVELCRDDTVAGYVPSWRISDFMRAASAPHCDVSALRGFFADE